MHEERKEKRVREAEVVVLGESRIRGKEETIQEREGKTRKGDVM